MPNHRTAKIYKKNANLRQFSREEQEISSLVFEKYVNFAKISSFVIDASSSFRFKPKYFQIKNSLQTNIFGPSINCLRSLACKYADANKFERHHHSATVSYEPDSSYMIQKLISHEEYLSIYNIFK